MTTSCAIPGCNHPDTPCTGMCIQKVEEWREEARRLPPETGESVMKYINNLSKPTPKPFSRENLERVSEIAQQHASQPQSALDIDATLADRGNRYGKFTGHAEITQMLKTVVSTGLFKRGKTLAADQQEAIDMILHKIGRIINGDPDYADSWVDIAGYAKLVADRLQGVTK